MGTQNQKKTTKQKQASIAQKIKRRWSQFPSQTDTPATGVEESTLSEMEKSSRLGLRALNDMYVIEEEPIDFEVDKPSGLTSAVVDLVKSGGLVLPETAEYYAKKYPCVGKVLTHGDKVKYALRSGTRVLFARHGGIREQIDGKDYVFIRECDLHCVLG